MLVGSRMLKNPAEIIPWTVDFGPILKPGETLGTPIFSAWELDKPLDRGGVAVAVVTDDLSDQGVVIDGTQFTQLVTAGESGKYYVLQLAASTSLGQLREAEVELFVKAVPTPVTP
jgi:hypothetical protein